MLCCYKMPFLFFITAVGVCFKAVCLVVSLYFWQMGGDLWDCMPYMLRNRGVPICQKLKVCYSYCRISSADVGGGWGGRYSAPHLSTRRKGEYCAPTIKRLSEGAGSDRANHQENERQEPPERKERKQQPQAKRKKPPTRRTTRGGTPTTPKDETRKDS